MPHKSVEHGHAISEPAVSSGHEHKKEEEGEALLAVAVCVPTVLVTFLFYEFIPIIINNNNKEHSTLRM